MLSGMVLMQLWYRFSVSKATRWQTSVGTSANLFLERSVERKDTKKNHNYINVNKYLLYSKLNAFKVKKWKFLSGVT